MPEALVDSNILIGFALIRDQHHEAADPIVRKMDAGDLPQGLVTNYAVAETMHSISKVAGHSKSVDLLNRLVSSGGFRLVHLSQEDFDRGQAVYRQRNGVNFVDSLMYSFMQRVELEHIYSFDDDFDKFEDITRLNASVNPFE